MLGAPWLHPAFVAQPSRSPEMEASVPEAMAAMVSLKHLQ